MSGIGRLPQPPGLQDPRFEDWLNQLRTQTLSHGFAPGVGNGGTVTQATSKSTAVTLNKSCGQITLNAANLVAGAAVSFTVNNSTVAATDIPKAVVASGGTANAYRADVTAVAAGSFAVTVTNITGGALAEAPVISFVVTKATTT